MVRRVIVILIVGIIVVEHVIGGIAMTDIVGV